MTFAMNLWKHFIEAFVSTEKGHKMHSLNEQKMQQNNIFDILKLFYFSCTVIEFFCKKIVFAKNVSKFPRKLAKSSK